MKNLKLTLILSSVVMLVAISCKKGDTGAQGAPGPAGPAGPDSIIYSPWITLSTAQQIPSPGDTLYTQEINAPSINAAALNNAVIASYLNLANDPTTEVDLVPVSAVSFAITETFLIGAIDLVSVVDLTGIPYRYVIVPGSIQGNRFVSGPAKGMTVSEVKSMSYNNILKLGKPVRAATSN